VHSPFRERSSAPRQGRRGGRGARHAGVVQARRGFEHALEDLASFRFIWVIFWFTKIRTAVFGPKCCRRAAAAGAACSPRARQYRPNPIGLSAVELLGIEGLKLSVRNLDMLDRTPILDLKPYVPYSDALGEANSGWLSHESAPDPLPEYQVAFAPRALMQLDFLAQHGVDIRERVAEVLRLGAQPHAYRRIKPEGEWLGARAQGLAPRFLDP
jgi:tRNA-Thr(GGU) m(6)t(6)A37 methyltransferase TsaA